MRTSLGLLIGSRIRFVEACLTALLSATLVFWQGGTPSNLRCVFGRPALFSSSYACLGQAGAGR